VIEKVCKKEGVMWKFLLGLFLGFIIGAIGLMFLVEKNGNEVNFFYKQGF